MIDKLIKDIQTEIRNSEDRLKMLYRIKHGEKYYRVQYMFINGHNGNEEDVETFMWGTSPQDIRAQLNWIDRFDSAELVEETPTLDLNGTIIFHPVNK